MPADHLTQDYQLVPVGELTEHPENPRRSDDRLIEELIRANGFYGVLTVQRATGHVLAGNGRLRAARRVGLETVPVVYVDVDDDEARRILLADNRASDIGVYDDEALTALLSTLQEETGLDGTGYTDADLKLLLGQLGEPGYGTAGHGLTPGERQAAFDAADVRTIVLPYQAERYGAIVTALGALMKALDMETFADVVATLVAQAVAEVATDP